MKSIKSIIVVIFFFPLITANSQNYPGKTNANNNRLVKGEPAINKSINQDENRQTDVNMSGIMRYKSHLGEKGGMYMKPGWVEGKLVLQDNKEIENWKYRYNIRFEQMQYTNGKDTLAFAEPTEIKYLHLDNGKTFVVEAYATDHGIDTGYFELVRKGENKLLYRRIITHHVIDETNESPEDDVYVHNDRWYVKFGDEPAKAVYLNKKCMLNVFGDKKAEVEKFIKEHNIRCKSRKDLISVFEFFNSLPSDLGYIRSAISVQLKIYSNILSD